MSANLPATSSSKIRREFAIHPNINNLHGTPKSVNRISARKIPLLINYENLIQPGRSGVLAIGSKPRQFLHKILGEIAIQEREGFQRW